jgi:VIT1/CCC1 family predicted Fe2+/Mn2+ transporter
MAHDALGAHARDELGFSHVVSTRPVQAAVASAGSFAVGAVMPLLTAAVAPERGMALVIAATSLLFLISLGGVAAGAGGASVWRGALRVAFWGVLAMAFTALVGWAFGVSMA